MSQCYQCLHEYNQKFNSVGYVNKRSVRNMIIAKNQCAQFFLFGLETIIIFFRPVETSEKKTVNTKFITRKYSYSSDNLPITIIIVIP